MSDMSKHLAEVLQPDGTTKWELVELRASELYDKDKPATVEEEKPKRTRKATFDTLETPETTDF